MVKIGGASLDEVSPYFHLPIEAAARELGVCSSALKRRCRRLGIKRWPFRKVKLIELNDITSNIIDYTFIDIDFVSRMNRMVIFMSSIEGDLIYVYITYKNIMIHSTFFASPLTCPRHSRNQKLKRTKDTPSAAPRMTV